MTFRDTLDRRADHAMHSDPCRRCRDLSGQFLVAGSAAILLLGYPAAAVVPADDWPQWRGPKRDGVWSEAHVRESFPAEGLPVRWRTPIRNGWSSPVVSHGKVFVTDVDLKPRPAQERMHCLDEATGKTVWTYAYDAVYPEWAFNPENSSPPAATPVVDAGRLYMIGGNGHVHCLDAESGNVVWENRLDQTYTIPTLSCRPSPLVDGDLLILLVGAKPGACVVALDKLTGKQVWSSLDDSISNSSPVIAGAGETRQLIVWTGESITSLAPATGMVNWREKLITSNNDSIATPVTRDRWLLVSGLMLELGPGQTAAAPVWPKSRAVSRRVLSNTSTPLLRGDHVYGARTGGELVCLDVRTGEQVWATDKVTGLKPGASIHLTPNGDVAWLFTDEGNLICARLSPAGYEELSRVHLLEPTSLFSGRLLAWVPPAFANRHVFARNDKEILCVSLVADR